MICAPIAVATTSSPRASPNTAPVTPPSAAPIAIAGPPTTAPASVAVSTTSKRCRGARIWRPRVLFIATARNATPYAAAAGAGTANCCPNSERETIGPKSVMKMDPPTPTSSIGAHTASRTALARSCDVLARFCSAFAIADRGTSDARNKRSPDANSAVTAGDAKPPTIATLATVYPPAAISAIAACTCGRSDVRIEPSAFVTRPHSLSRTCRDTSQQATTEPEATPTGKTTAGSPIQTAPPPIRVPIILGTVSLPNTYQGLPVPTANQTAVTPFRLVAKAIAMPITRPDGATVSAVATINGMHSSKSNIIRSASD